ncbi:MAG: neutral/alkaline non-lysosomal ceramidase N-terminal domain-containing protein [Bryobacteraceae bacterium]|nr:neutral/alkaline non-lysosomal ceramidase N-terminal domain-containing protein [Bryobacteraceae bacterium]
MLPKSMLAVVLICAGALSAAAQDLLAGIAKIEITPAFNGPMYGYSNRKCGESTAVHDPLFAKALVLQAGSQRVAIVTIDLGSISSDAIFRRVADELNIPVLILSLSHTHSGPAFMASSLGGKEPSPYLKELETKLFVVVKQASASMAPARLALGRGSIQLGYNRLLPRDDGRSRALFDNLDRVPYGPVDPEVGLIRIDAADGRPRALMVHYTAHPVTLGSTNCLYSADYPGVMKARVESAMPGVETMFVQGAAGDTNPLFQGRTGNSEADFATMTKMGELLAAEVLRAAKSMEPLPAGPASIVSKTQTLPFKGRWDQSRAFPVGITTLLINGKIAIATVPGEPLLALQTRWKSDAGVPYPFFYGYTQTTSNPWPGYLPDIKSAAHGGYGADNATNIEVAAAERIMDQHLVNLYALRGMWLDKPGRP